MTATKNVPQRTRPGEQLFYRVGTECFHWFWNTAAEAKGYTGGNHEDAIKNARKASRKSGQPIELCGRVRINDYVGSPNWGEYRVYKTVR